MRNYNLSLAANFALDCQNPKANYELLVKNYKGRKGVINNNLVITFPDKSKVISSSGFDSWEVKDKYLAIDFIFDFMELKGKLTAESFRNLMQRSEAEKMGDGILRFPDGTEAQFSEPERIWKIINL